MAAAIDDQTRVVFLGNPNNPTGSIYRRAEWQRFLKRTPPRVVIVADEAYFEFVRDRDYPNSLEDQDGERFLITMRTFSKIFGLAGLRVGYVVARPDIVRLLNNVRQPFNVNSLAQVAVIAAMDDAEHVRRTLDNNRAGIEYLERELTRLKLEFVPSQANFILANVGAGRAVYDALLRKGVIVRPMNGYGLPRHVRISVGLEDENRKLVAALAEVMARRRRGPDAMAQLFRRMTVCGVGLIGGSICDDRPARGPGRRDRRAGAHAEKSRPRARAEYRRSRHAGSRRGGARCGSGDARRAGAHYPRDVRRDRAATWRATPW